MGLPTRILLIDDDQVDRTAVRRALRSSGLDHDLVEAPDGATGLRRAEAGSFDCVLLDYRLPDMDAFDVLKGLLSSSDGNQAVVMLTGEADQDVAFRLMRAGALDYLSKTDATPSSLARAIRYAQARLGFLSELEDKSRALDTLNRQKSLLFSIISHDLRNPFQAVLGLSHVLSQSVAARDIESIERRAQGMHQAATQAYNLMESLFAWANLQMDTLAVAFSDVDLAEVVGDTINGAADAAADKGLSLRQHHTQHKVWANRDMLAAVLRNLVSNAIKFTLPGGTVTISAAWCPSGATISVTDTGIGMPPSTVKGLFRLDRRLTTSGTAGERGSGLGLLLCRDLVERQGGELHVKSHVGHGTTFWFVLPSVEPAEPL